MAGKGVWGNGTFGVLSLLLSSLGLFFGVGHLDEARLYRVYEFLWWFMEILLS